MNRILSFIAASFLVLGVAGPAKALDIERAGIKTYLHTPTPGLLRAALRSAKSDAIWSLTDRSANRLKAISAAAIRRKLVTAQNPAKNKGSLREIFMVFVRNMTRSCGVA